MSVIITDQQQFDMNKPNYITSYSNTSSFATTVMQPGQNFNKEVVTVSPMIKMESSVDNKSIKSEYKMLSNESQQLAAVKSGGGDLTQPRKCRGHIDRYNGMTEEEVMQRTLPDYLQDNLDLIVVGINPSMTSACVGHHYAGIGNHFWTCITEAGLVPEAVTCFDDYRMVDYGIGFTNVCSRPTKGAAEISRKEMKAGAMLMLEKMRKYKPKIAVFNGKGIYEAFIGHKNFYMGKQPKPLDGTDIIVFVMPSSSARCAQLPRAEDKLPFFVALRKLRDFIRGDIKYLSDEEVIFADYTEFRVTQPDPKSLRKAERRRKRKAEMMMSSNHDTLVSTTVSKAARKASSGKGSFLTDRTLQKGVDGHSAAGTALTGGGSSNKDSIDLNMSSADLTPVTLTDAESTAMPQIECPIAVYNQSTGIISIIPAAATDISGGAFSLSGGSPIVMMPSATSTTTAAKQNTILQNKNVVTKPILIQQDGGGQAFILAAPSPIIQTHPQQHLQAAQTATLVPVAGTNTAMALLQPSQIFTASGQLIDTSAFAWAPQGQIQTQQQHHQQTTQQQQQAPQILTQTSNGLVYQQQTQSQPQPQHKAGVQQQPQQQIICTAATLQQLLQQQQTAQQNQQIQIINQFGYPQQITIQTPLGLTNGFQLQQIATTAGCIGESIPDHHHLSGQDSIGTTNNNGNNAVTSHNSSRDPGGQSVGQGMIFVSAGGAGTGQGGQYAYMAPSQQHIVIPIAATAGGGLVQIGGGQSATQVVQIHHQQTRSRPLTSSSSTSGISSVAGQTELDLLSTSSGVIEASQLYQHAPVQLADCEDQLVQCSSTDEKLLYAAL